MKKKNPCPVRKTKKMELKPIESIALSAGVKKKHLEPCGPYKAKVSPDILKSSKKKKKKTKYILITSVTPTILGEGKTLTAIALSMAFKKLKKKAIACIPQPSLAGVFGIKGTGTGSGCSRVLPTDSINLHFTGDGRAVEAAHNLCAAYLDDSIFKGNHFDVNTDSIIWKRVVDVNDRALRNVNIGMGGKSDGVSRKTTFELTAASELMAILTLSQDFNDLRSRIASSTVAFTKKEKPLTCEDMKATGAISALLRDALKPNIVQTIEGTPCFVHTSSKADVSIGGTSVIADKIALGISDYVITETGFGADLGAEKFFDIKCRASGLSPDAAVIVCTTRALKVHSGDFNVTSKKIPREFFRENVSAIERGLSNLEKQIENLRTFGVPVVICINRFNGDSEKEINAIHRRAADLGAHSVAVNKAWSDGGEGAVELAKRVIEASSVKSTFRFLYPLDIPITDKIKRIAKTLYGATEVTYSEEAQQKMALFKKLKIDNLPICMVKTPFSLSHNIKKKGRPHSFRLPVDDLYIASGAGYIAAICSHAQAMPGLPSISRTAKIDINENGEIAGLV